MCNQHSGCPILRFLYEGWGKGEYYHAKQESILPLTLFFKVVILTLERGERPASSFDFDLPALLFAYETLRQSQSSHNKFTSHLQPIGTAQLRGKLYDLSEYRAAIFTRTKSIIPGELFLYPQRIHPPRNRHLRRLQPIPTNRQPLYPQTQTRHPHRHRPTKTSLGLRIQPTPPQQRSPPQLSRLKK